MKEGDTVIVPMPQVDGMVKNRPAVVLRAMPPFRDVLVCGVSTQLHQAAKDFAEVISPSDADFVLSGLKEESLISLGFLVVVPRNNIAGPIVSISSAPHTPLFHT